MFTILTKNKISATGLAALTPDTYAVTDTHDNPDAIIVRSASLHDDTFGSSLVAIARAGAGVNNIPINIASGVGIAVFNTPGANANAVKELVICALFLAARKVVAGAQWALGLKGEGSNVGKLVEKGKGAFGGGEIAGKTLGVIGLGAIGALTANAAAALGMRVTGYDPYLSVQGALKLDPSAVVTDDLNTLLATSDYISLHLPLTDATRGFINAQSLTACKEAVRILNFARAELVDDADLIDALGAGKVAAYVTDFPTDAQLGTPGVTALPHLGASTEESEENCAVMASRELKDYLEQGIVTNSVNLPDTKLPAKTSPRICVVHEGISGLVAQIGTAVGANVTNLFSAEKKGVGYTVLDVAEPVDAAAISGIPGVRRVRVI
ncbi:MAG: 3-phosphoglycerate dehydrogenase [Oscillospiraceae bacterium]|jgi:D-3-phosphoglycerate dehydrogenase|nr:3-phosphoglycerate dehydrogenase [Oscillospiraceae bacterium]